MQKDAVSKSREHSRQSLLMEEVNCGEKEKLTLSKSPHSQISCSRALVLMAIVKRMWGNSNWKSRRCLWNGSSTMHKHSNHPENKELP